MADFDRSNVGEAGVEPCRGGACPVVRENLQALDGFDAQYARDLAVIERCEQQIEERAGCPDFFGWMAVTASRSTA